MAWPFQTTTQPSHRALRPSSLMSRALTTDSGCGWVNRKLTRWGWTSPRAQVRAYVAASQHIDVRQSAASQVCRWSMMHIQRQDCREVVVIDNGVLFTSLRLGHWSGLSDSFFPRACRSGQLFDRVPDLYIPNPGFRPPRTWFCPEDQISHKKDPFHHSSPRASK